MEDKLEQLRIAAESGDMNAMCEYGKKLAENRKFSDAFKWLEKSKDLNDTEVLGSLGMCYLYGKGTDKNIKEAVNCFLRAVELGAFRGAYFIYHISHIYDNYVNFDEVVRIFEKQNNNIPTENVDVEDISMLKFMLACCYYWGVGTEKDEEHAKKLLKSAGYDFDEDNTPLFIKKIIMAFPLPYIDPICYDFLYPFQKKINALFSLPFYWFYHVFKSEISSNEATVNELYEFLKKQNNDGRWFYIKALPKVNANLMYNALLEDNFQNFIDVCLKEPNFIECVLLHVQLKAIYNNIDDLLSIDNPDYDIENESNFVLVKSLHFVTNLIGFDKAVNLWKRFNCDLLETQDLPELIRRINALITFILHLIFLIQGILRIGISEEEISLNAEELRFFDELTHLVNQQKYSKEIYEFKKYCINTPALWGGLESTKEELSLILDIVDESPNDRVETINFKDVIIPDTYKCEIFDGCEKVYEKFFEKLKSIHYIDDSTSFESFKIAIGLVPKPEEGFFKRVIWKSMYGNRANWKPLLNMLRLIGIKREDLKPKTLTCIIHSRNNMHCFSARLA